MGKKVKDCSQFLEKHKQDIKMLFELLNDKLKLQINSSPISKAIVEIEKCAKTSSVLHYSISGLILPIDKPKHLKPQELTNLYLRVDYEVEIDIAKWGNNEDPFNSYSFAIALSGNCKGREQSIGWHIDKDAALDSDEYHPLYHIHYSNGQTCLGNIGDFDWGNSISLDSPRLAHYPMDIILGIGFCLTNFYPKSVFENFKRLTYFPKVYKDSQEAVLKPYFHTIASHWPNNRQSKCYELCPQII